MKQVKGLTWLYLFFTLLSIPTYVSCYLGGPLTDLNFDTKVFFSLFTLGNLGQQVSVCAEAPLGQNTIETYCSFGQALTIEFFGMVSQDETNEECNGNLLRATIEPICDLTEDSTITDSFKEQCQNKKFCNFTFEQNLFPAECHDTANKTTLIVYCEEKYIKVGSWDFDKLYLTWLVVFIDAAIVYSFTVFLIQMRHQV